MKHPQPIFDWVVMKLDEQTIKIPGVILPDDGGKNIERIGTEELEILFIGPEVKYLKPGMRIRPQGLIGQLTLEGRKFYVVREKDVSCHIVTKE